MLRYHYKLSPAMTLDDLDTEEMDRLWQEFLFVRKSEFEFQSTAIKAAIAELFPSK